MHSIAPEDKESKDALEAVELQYLSNHTEVESVSPGRFQVGSLNMGEFAIDSPVPQRTEIEWGPVMVLLALYFIQGLGLGTFASIGITLIEKGATAADLSILSFQAYPFALKLFFAPLLDTYYFSGFGKRKTYIIPAQYAFAVVFFVISSFIDGLIADRAVIAITVLGVIATSLLAVQDVAVDGWATTILRPEHVAYGSTCQAVGQGLGIFIAFNLFILLNGWLKSYYNVHVPTSLLFIGIAVFTACTTVIVHFFKKERNPPEMNKEGICSVLQVFKAFGKNRNLRLLIAILLLWRLAFAPVDHGMMYILIKKGMSKEKMTEVMSILTPIFFVVSIFVGKLATKRRELEMLLWIFVLRALDNIFHYFVIQSCDKDNLSRTYALLIISGITGTAISTSSFVSNGAFFNRICDQSVGGTYLTILNSVSNAGGMITGSLVLFLMERVPFTPLCIVFWIFGVFYFLRFRRVHLELQAVDKSSWAVTGDVHLVEMEPVDIAR
eukprot:TRINITY_DN13874_c0_g1_i3.p1 TRINITY_DN13874_c0_g1~~TRINITY_DN13874_c0_g1_i3.p1  ORF type:complete len:497 (+),score=50.91 TRINITY_DN13874_c0_g1_i3:128-1618(+)